MQSFVKCFCLFATLAAVSARDLTSNFCNVKCDIQVNRLKKAVPHVLCGYTGNFVGAKCFRGGKQVAELVEMTKNLQDIAVNAHNAARNKVAGGLVPKHPHACNMTTMLWDEDLAKTAKALVLKCEDDHDRCHNTAGYEHAGQNIYVKQSTAKYTDYEKLIAGGVESWMKEDIYSNKGIIHKLPVSLSNIGHFTVLVRDNNNRVGCAAAIVYLGEREKYPHKFIFVCNYATTNIIDSRVYHWNCASPAANCESGTNKYYKNLCSETTKVDPNSYVLA